MEYSETLLSNDPGVALLSEYMSHAIEKTVNEKVTILWHSVKDKIRPLKQRVTDLEEEVSTLKQKITELEKEASSLNEKLAKNEGSLAHSQLLIGNLQTKVEHLETLKSTDVTEPVDSTLATEASGLTSDGNDDTYDDDEDPLKFLDDNCNYSDVEVQMWGKSEEETTQKSKGKLDRKEEQGVKRVSRAKQPESPQEKRARGRGRPQGSRNVAPSKAELAKRLELHKKKIEKSLTKSATESK